MKVILTTILFAIISFSSYSQEISKKEKLAGNTKAQVENFSGVVDSWAADDDYVYSGFYLKACNLKQLVVFSPQMGKILRKNIQINALVLISGFEELSDLKEKYIRLVTIKIADKIIYDTLYTVTKTRITEKCTVGHGKIIELQKDSKGMPEGFILDNHTILRMLPEYIKMINKIALVGTEIYYTGNKEILPKGETTLMNYTVINCNEFTIGGKQYFIR